MIKPQSIIKTLAVWIILAGMLSGCSHAIDGTPEIGVDQTATALISAISSPSPSPAPVIVTSSSTIPTHTLNHPLSPCPGGGAVIDTPEFRLDGALIFQADEYSEFYRIGGESMIASKLLLPDSDYYNFLGISPDGQWLAVQPLPFEALLLGMEFNPEALDLWLFSEQGQLLQQNLELSFLRQENPEISEIFILSANAYWINNELMYVEPTIRSGIAGTDSRNVISRPLVLDPFGGQWLTDQFVDGLPVDDIESLALTPDLNQALLYTADGQLGLLNRDQGSMLWERMLQDGDVSASILRSSPDGKQMLFGNLNQTLTGVLTLDPLSITVIAQQVFPHGSFSNFSNAWSPDSHYIAFLNETSIALFDTQLMRYKYICPFAEDWIDDWTVDMAWSPDSRYLAIGGELSNIRVLDIETGAYIDLGTLGIPRAWSSAVFDTALMP